MRKLLLLFFITISTVINAQSYMAKGLTKGVYSDDETYFPETIASVVNIVDFSIEQDFIQITTFFNCNTKSVSILSIASITDNSNAFCEEYDFKCIEEDTNTAHIVRFIHFYDSDKVLIFIYTPETPYMLSNIQILKFNDGK